MILVTGGTDVIGGELLRLLSHAGVPARALRSALTEASSADGDFAIIADAHRGLLAPDIRPPRVNRGGA